MDSGSTPDLSPRATWECLPRAWGGTGGGPRDEPCPSVQVLCGRKQRYVHVGVRGRALGQPHLLRIGGTQGRRGGLLL